MWRYLLTLRDTDDRIGTPGSSPREAERVMLVFIYCTIYTVYLMQCSANSFAECFDSALLLYFQHCLETSAILVGPGFGGLKQEWHRQQTASVSNEHSSYDALPNDTKYLSNNFIMNSKPIPTHSPKATP